jgi:hypothetical protein
MPFFLGSARAVRRMPLGGTVAAGGREIAPEARWCANRPAVVCRPFSVCVQRIRAEPGMPRPVVRLSTLHPTFASVRLIGQSPRAKSSVDDYLVAKHRRLNRTPAIIARASLPAHASVLCNHCEMLVALRGCRFIRNSRDAWWNDDCCFRMTLDNDLVDDLAILCPVCCHQRNVNIDLIKEV